MEMLLLSVCGLHKVYLKTKNGKYSAVTGGIQGFFTQNPAVATKTGWIFGFSAARKGYSLFTV